MQSAQPQRQSFAIVNNVTVIGQRDPIMNEAYGLRELCLLLSITHAASGAHSRIWRFSFLFFPGASMKMSKWQYRNVEFVYLFEDI